jgi:DNA repair exonuclease SbcCD ATPase subunit
VILTSLYVAGFGRLTDRRFDFASGLNVVYGPNESGKSTLANAIVATLYGAERKKDGWRPWSGGAFSSTLVYVLATGERIEIQRDFERDAKGLHVYDRAGNEISAKLPGHKFIPGEAHLGVPLDVFLNAACVKQQAMAIDEGKHAGPLAAHLARALDGGPREDAALGAIARLDEALRAHVGSERARKNTPLRDLRALAHEQRTQVEEARAQLAARDDLRDRMERAGQERERLTSASAEIERRIRSLRAGAIAKRLTNLRDFRAELAELQADHAAYADVAGFSPERANEIDEAYRAWEAAGRAAATEQTQAESARPDEAERAELEQLRRDAGSVDDATFEALSAAHARANAARAAASSAAREAATARADTDGGSLRSVAPAAGIAALCVAIGFAIAHSWTWTALAAVAAAIGLGAAFLGGRERTQRARSARAKQRSADEALAAEGAAANAVSAVLDPLGIERFEELAARRTRLAELLARKRAFEACMDRVQAARFAADAAGARFDRLAVTLVPETRGERAARKAAVDALAARRRERDGIAAHLHALEMRKSTIMGDDDEFALESELLALQHGGVEAAVAEDAAAGALRAAEQERTAVAEQLRTAGDTFARLGGQLTGLQAQVTDLAELDERLARTQAEIARIEGFERAVRLAKTTLEARTGEAHRAFARRLEDYAATTLSAITGGRYAELFVDPKTLAIRVRVPETGAIADLDAVSAGTRDQTYLVVRFAMARMFSEGIETPPLLLDDPFAFWDAERIERCLPIVEHGARNAQAILFTSSKPLADAAARRGAHRIDLPQPALVEHRYESVSASAAGGGSIRSTAMRI